MKKFLNVLIMLFFLTAPVFGQENISISHNNEHLDSLQFSKLLHAYNSIVRTNSEEIDLLKIDLIGPALYGMSWLGDGNDSTTNHIIKVVYETKFKPAWSWLVQADIRADKNRIRELGLNAGIRHYYNMNKRMLQGKSANNFSANYFSGFFDISTIPQCADYHFSFNAVYGIQRRLGKIGFLDFNIGLESILNAYSGKTIGVDFTAELLIGIAF